MTDVYDVMVVGLGAMGSAALYQSSKENIKVLGIDRYVPPHSFGSSHGDTRITRQAVGEGAAYVPLVLRSNKIWSDIEKKTGRTLFNKVGTVLISSPKSGQHGVDDFYANAVELAESWNIEHSTLDSKELINKFPQFNLRGDEVGYTEAGAGYLIPEECIETQLSLARQQGAEIVFGEKVIRVVDDNGIQVVETTENKYRAKKVIVTPGAWVNDFLPKSSQALEIHREVLYWFEIKNNYERLKQMPTFIWLFGSGAGELVYGFPAIDGEKGGLKLATESKVNVSSPDEMNKVVSEQEKALMYKKYVKKLFPDLGKEVVKAEACMYTVSPDYGFIIDYHPENQNIIIASPCSGHGFKHSAAVGELLSQMALSGKTDISIDAFKLSRFSS